MAALHATAFEGAARWSAQSFRDMLRDPATLLLQRPGGFLLGRVAGGEAELLTVVVDVDARRRGVGGELLAAFVADARARGASEAFLEVAEDNRAARALYARGGWAPVGRRPGYYGGGDALILRRGL